MPIKRLIVALVTAMLVPISAPIDIAHGADVVAGIPVNTEREAYYGDVHLITAHSFVGSLMGARLGANDAYRFARGESVTVDGKSITRRSAPLDFLAVTDFGEYLGLFGTLDDPNSPFSQSDIGKQLRDPATRSAARKEFMAVALNRQHTHEARFGLDPEVMNTALASGWKQNIEAANANYRPGAFTTFIGFHWTAKRGGTQDRVVLFSGDKAPLPFTPFDSLRPEDLWTYLETNRKGGFDALAIPHNSNISNGLMFNGLDSDGKPIDRAYAERRAVNEPVVEISSNGQSETHPKLSPADEFTDFEMFGNEKMEDPRGSYVRDALGRGLEIAQKIGVDPYRLGFIGSTDFHTGMSDASEDATDSLPDALDPTRPVTEEALLQQSQGAHPYASGSLAGVWAEQNTRESIFAALRRRETFATSGTRLKFRFFGSWNYDRNVLKRKDWIKAAYRLGVPMGRDLPANRNAKAVPTFLAWATKDPTGANLDRLQIVKLWLENGKYVERIYDVALSGGRSVDPRKGKAPTVGNTVDLRNARYTNTIGAPELAVMWADPHFDASAPAAYYLRVLEIPTPRWSTVAAVKAGIPPAKGLQVSIQERGWSSPVWYTPRARS